MVHWGNPKGFSEGIYGETFKIVSGGILKDISKVFTTEFTEKNSYKIMCEVSKLIIERILG